MTKLHMHQCELTYEGAFVRPAFAICDCPGRLCDLLLDALQPLAAPGTTLSSRKANRPSEASPVKSTN